MEINPVGKIVNNKKQCLLTIDLPYKKALRNVKEFSHVIVFYSCSDVGKTQDYLYEEVFKILSEETDNGLILSASKQIENDFSGFVFDIKPYFPCEDRVEKSNINTDCLLSPLSKISLKVDNDEFLLQESGVIRKNVGKVWLEFNSLNNADEAEKYFSSFSHVKIIWWFSRFDDKKYRRAVECNPPYNGVGRTGIFASRSPVRPNPIAMTTAKIISFDKYNSTLFINNIECFDKTPFIAIIPYNKANDKIDDFYVPKELASWPKYFDDSNVNEISEQTKAIINSEYSVLSDEQEKLDTKSKKSFVVEDDFWEDKTVKTKLDGIIIKGARENNLKGFDCEIPYNKINVVVGVSGSGKSSLVFDTVYFECKRRMDGISGDFADYKRAATDCFLGAIPTVAVSQKEIGSNVRSVVGTYSDAYDYLRRIFSAVGVRHCPQCGNVVPTHDKLKNENVCPKCGKLLFNLSPSNFNFNNPESMCPVCNGYGEVQEVDIDKLIEKPELSILDGASSFWGKLRNFRDNSNANWMKGEVLAIADKMKIDLEIPWNNLPNEYKQKVLYGTNGELLNWSYKNKKNGREGKIERPGEGLVNIIERFARENPGAESVEKYMKKSVCKTCNGERLSLDGLLVTIGKKRYPQIAKYNFVELAEWCKSLPAILGEAKFNIVKSDILKLYKISCMMEKCGIAYIALDRRTSTLSGGEQQRLKLVNGLEQDISGLLYVLDEPSKGLHPKDYNKIAQMISLLKEKGNTILMVEHNEDMIKIGDNILEIGPAAGINGGYLVANSSYNKLVKNSNSIMGKKYCIEKNYRKIAESNMLKIKSAVFNNLKSVSVGIHLNAITCICGVSGSGKSSLMKGVIFHDLERILNKQKPEFCKSIENANLISDVILADQAAIGRSPRSVPATYIGLMDKIRTVFASCESAKEKGINSEAFSFNNTAGQCPNCLGGGKIQPKYSDDIWITCPVCNGKRYNQNVLDINYKGKTISDVLDLSIDEAIDFFSDDDQLLKPLKILKEAGLAYIKLGQNSASLSGGEASRLKLSKQLFSAKAKNTLFLFDEPTTGLSNSDVVKLLELFNKLVEDGATVVMIEHNKIMTENADYLIEVGPGAGKDGGEILNK